MRAAVVILSVGLYVPVLAQTTGFTLAQYNAPQYTAPEDAPSRVVIAGKDEPGERLVVTGHTLDGEKPVAGVSLYVKVILRRRCVVISFHEQDPAEDREDT